MATVFDSPFIRQRIHRLRQRDIDFDEEQRFGRCDCTSYSYFVLSMDMAAVQAEQAYSSQIPRNASSTTLPPSYDALIASSTVNKPQPSGSEPPPPTYDEAMYLIDEEKLDNTPSENVKQESSDANLNKP
ncbi:hypothetical protein EVAR_70750_1 [Eumeta japonica]|uniref:Uncharacterized protein n=1 Tax=Eumeta variegata TaxID=151549 RepID=A0A4C2A7S5_EUMVA|nr:hypothetical protein EVAR_70750_1 [Eumeta japonica]